MAIQKWLITKAKGGCGIFLTANECDGGGRKIENVLKARASFVDLDKKGLPAKWALHPDIVVQSSPGKFWAFWLIEPTTDLRAWSDTQARLASFYGGESVNQWRGIDGPTIAFSDDINSINGQWRTPPLTHGPRYHGCALYQLQL